MKHKRVVSIVLNNFKNDSRVLKESVSLQQAGYDVTVVALHEAPLKVHEQVQGITVHRIVLRTRGWSKRLGVQLFKYGEFVFKTVRGYRRADIFHCNDLNTLPIGVLVKTLINRRAKIVYDAHEYETETQHLRGLKKRLAKYVERRLIGFCDTTIVVSASIAKEYARLYGIPQPALVLNTPHYRAISKTNHFRDSFGITPDQTIFLYQGALSAGRGIEKMLEAFSGLQEEGAVLVVMGYGALTEQVQEHAATYGNIFYHEAVSPDVVLEYTASADVGLSLIENCCLSYYYCLPNKMFEYAMAGLPLMVSNLPEMRHMVETHGVGVVVDGNGAVPIADAVTRMLAMDWGAMRHNLQGFVQQYHWGHQEQTLLDTYKALHA